MKLTNNSWPSFASSVASNGDPTEHSPAAMERLMALFKPYMTHVRVPHGKYRSINKCELVDFISPESQLRYTNFYDDYLKTMSKIRNSDGDVGQGRMAELAAFNKLAEGASIEKAPIMVERMIARVNEGFASGAAIRYRQAIVKMVRGLMNKGVPRSEISLIWGGDDSLDKSKRLSNKDIAKWMKQLVMAPETVSKKIQKLLYRQLSEDEEQRSEAEADYGEDLKLGNQSREERQSEIDKYQSGKSLFCIYTYASGGAGLSLHHVAKNDYGKIVELRPRRSYLDPIYSPQDFVQGLGRFHRSIFSLSNTEQTILFFRNTIEVHVMQKVSLKLRCLKKVVRQSDDWKSAIWEASNNPQDFNRQLEQEAKQVVIDPEDDGGIDIGTSPEDDE